MARTLALDLIDAGLLGVADLGSVLGPSPGVALVDAESPPVFGREALARCRLRPRHVSSEFWARLDTRPLGPPFPEGLSGADLVYGHLETLWREGGSGADEVLLAVPGVYDERQLGLLLGIAGALAMPVAGLVDSAVATASAGFAGERLLHVELGLRWALVTEVRQGPALARERVARIDGWGLDDVHEAELRGAAAAFVRAARFDPLHDAATEQALFDRLPGFLAALGEGDRATLRVPRRGQEESIEVARADVEGWTARFAGELAQQVAVLKRPGEPATVLVSPRAARLPGLVERLAAARGVEVALVPAHAAAAGALRHREAVRAADGGVRLVTVLPRPEEPEAGASGLAVIVPPPPRPRPPAAPGRRPTHVLLGSEARAITDEPLVIGTAPPAAGRAWRLEGETTGVSRVHCRLVESAGEAVVEDLSSWGTFVNGERVAGRAVVAVGDRIRVGSPGLELVLIEAEG